MKKLYILLLAVSGLGYAQTPIITGIMDGDCNGGNPKAIEIYANGTVNFAEYSVENQTNANSTWGTTLSLAPLGTVTNGFVYVILGGTPSATAADPTPIENVARFALEFPSIPTASVLNPPSGTGLPQPINVNGDDRVRIINSTTLTVIDQYGVEAEDGTGKPWEYLDSWAKRNNGTLANGSSFNAANWTFGGVAALDGLGACQAGATFSTLVPFGTYSPNLSVKQNAIAGLDIYPNPVTNGVLNINTTANDAKNVVIVDILGKQVVNTTISGSTVNVANLKNGVYIVKITENGKTATRKLVIR
jgi:hypothetical protein